MRPVLAKWRLVARARTRRDRSRPLRESGPLASARRAGAFPALYRGELLADFGPVSEAFDEWKLGESARVAALAVTTFKRLASIQAEAGDLAAAIALAQRLVGFDPLREDAHRLLMRLFVEERAEALRQFAACAEILERELSIAPDAETAALAQSIRQNAWISGNARWPESDIPAAATAPAANRVIAAVPPAPWPIAHWSPLAEGGFDASLGASRCVTKGSGGTGPPSPSPGADRGHLCRRYCRFDRLCSAPVRGVAFGSRASVIHGPPLHRCERSDRGSPCYRRPGRHPQA